MSVYLCSISYDIQDGYEVNQCFLLCRLCLNELIDSFLNGIDIFCSCSLKTGNRLLLMQLLWLECPSNEGSMFKRLMAGMIIGL